MEFNLQASSQDFSGLDQNWIEDDQTSAPASENEGGLESKSTDSLRLHPVNLNPDARPFLSYENGSDLTIKITPSSQSTLTDTEYQRNNSSIYSKSDSFDSWYPGPNTTPVSSTGMSKYSQQQQQLPPRGVEANNRYASYNNMISSLGQYDQNPGPSYGSNSSFDMPSGGGLYGSGSGSGGLGVSRSSPRIGSLGSSQDDYSGGGYGGGSGGGGVGMGNLNSMAYGGRPMNNAGRPGMGGGGVGGVGLGGGGAGGSNRSSPSYGAAVAAAQLASPYGGGGGVGGGGVGGGSVSGGGQYSGMAAMNRYGGGGTMNSRVSPPSAAGGAARYGGGVAPVYGAPMNQHMGYGQQMGMNNNVGHDSMQGTIYEVQFKAAFRYFVMDPMNPVEVNVGEFVIVEGDRGEDLGIVTQTMSMMAFIELKCQMNNSSLDEHENSVKRILRIASAYERQQLPAKYYDEQQVIEYCNELISAKYQIPLIIVNAEYQFDRNKITLYYDATTRIDFRELVRDLYSTFKTRIWMKQVDDHKPFYPLQFATMSLATGAQFNP